tara:strand:- start:4069 stop:4725 length:657 start_codon:yes stop_codon:yes gene_type:complete
MNWREEHRNWVCQVEKLKETLKSLKSTDPKNLLQHFFLQAIQHEFASELEKHKNTIKDLICTAVEHAHRLSGTPRAKSRAVLEMNGLLGHSIIRHIHLADIRNRAVFEVYKQCGVTIDTYFERYSSPPGSEEQNYTYSSIAHGSATATAVQTVTLSNVLTWMQILKRVFTVYDHIHSESEVNEYNLNWIGATWIHRIRERSLGDLIWELYLDLWITEN